MEEIEEVRKSFSAIYAEKKWSIGSGPGSMPRHTIEYRAYLERFIELNAVKFVTDFGCGDWQFSRYIDWNGISYTGIDIVPAVVTQNKKEFSSENIVFKDFTDVEDLPGGDLLIAKEVLQHLPNDEVKFYLEIMRRKYKFLLITNAIEPRKNANREISAGAVRPLRLDEEPFFMKGCYVYTYSVYHHNVGYKNGVYLMFGQT